ncbi:MAG: methylmalonyl Co-A mutase-associated GTPase MeaB [Planctomycetes bacterium]|nr:methylmalonyl Co-A mutase-associated GTPase MeaB [Planctomycetota bacterium]
MNNTQLVKNILKGHKVAVSRAISLVENEHKEADKLLSQLYCYVGKAKRIGITGPPGIGKSTLVNELVIAMRKQNKKVGVIAIDPSSIFSGGAILGDRIRMQQIGVDENVFIRSMATRGVHGGLNRTASEVADILDAAGKDYIIFETVGVGQSEVEIFRTADVTVVVLSPESGDSIQAMKSGLMEIADIIAVNKSDLPGADAFVGNLRNTLEISRSGRGNNKHIAIIKTQANQGIGITELLDTITGYLGQIAQSGQLAIKRQELLKERIKSLILCKIENTITTHPQITRQIEEYLKECNTKPKITPYELVDKVIKRVVK